VRSISQNRRKEQLAQSGSAIPRGVQNGEELGVWLNNLGGGGMREKIGKNWGVGNRGTSCVFKG